MRYSLRVLILVFTVVAVVIGVRESVRMYHWHRRLPITYSHSVSIDYPNEASVSFKAADVKRVEAESQSQRDLLAEEILDDLLETGGFWVMYRSDLVDQDDYGSVRLFEEAEENAPVVGFGPEGTAGERHHAQPFEESYSFAYPKSVRASVAKLIRKQCQTESGLELPRDERLLSHWLCSSDDQATQWVEDRLKDSDPGRRIELLRFLVEPNIAFPRRHQKTLGARPEFRSAITRMLESESDSEERQLALRIAGRYQVEEAAVWALSKISRWKPLELEAKPVALVLEEIRHRLSLLSLANNWTSRPESLPALDDLLQHCSSLHLKYEVAPENAIRSQWSPIQFEIEQLGWRAKDTLRAYCRNASDRERTKAAAIGYRFNALHLFVTHSTKDNREELDLLFERRQSLASQEFLVDFYSPRFGLAKAGDYERFLEKLPNPKSGLEERFAIDSLVDALLRHEEKFSQERILQLMKERVEYAFEKSGDLFRGTGNEEVISLLTTEIESQVDREELVESRSQQPVQITQSALGCFGGIPGRRMVTSFVDVGAVSKDVCLVSLSKITPLLAKEFVSRMPDHWIEPEEKAEIRWLELLEKMKANGIEPDLKSWEEGSNQSRNCIPLFVRSFRNANRYSYVSTGWRVRSLAMMVDAICLAAPEFNPDCVANAVDTKMPQFEIEMAVDKRVYTFRIRSVKSWFVDPMALIDIVNACLKRQKSGDRMVAVSNGVGYHVFCAPRELADFMLDEGLVISGEDVFE